LTIAITPRHTNTIFIDQAKGDPNAAKWLVVLFSIEYTSKLKKSNTVDTNKNKTKQETEIT